MIVNIQPWNQLPRLCHSHATILLISLFYLRKCMWDYIKGNVFSQELYQSLRMMKVSSFMNCTNKYGNMDFKMRFYITAVFRAFIANFLLLKNYPLCIFPSWIRLTCTSKWAVRAKLRSQIEHLWHFFPSCTELTSLFNWSIRAKLW